MQTRSCQVNGALQLMFGELQLWQQYMNKDNTVIVVFIADIKLRLFFLLKPAKSDKWKTVSF